MKWGVVCGLVLCFFLFDCAEWGFGRGSPFYTHFTYRCVHVTLVHLLMNLTGVFCVFGICSRLRLLREAVVASFAGAFVGSFVLVPEVVTAGASGFVYAMSAAVFAAVASGWRVVRDWRVFLSFALCIAVGLVAGIFVPGVNGVVHVASFVAGFVLLFVYYCWKIK
jgi:membrane associated rhomboid family serine protease